MQARRDSTLSFGGGSPTIGAMVTSRLLCRLVRDSYSDFALAVAARDNGRAIRVSYRQLRKSRVESSGNAIKTVIMT